MDLRLFSIEQAPKSLPVWETILQDLGSPPAPRIARALDVGASTVYRWNQTGRAPRVACLALFWLTRWGRSEIDAQATNDALTATALARALGDERNMLRGRVALLSEERDRLSQVVQRFQALAAHRAAPATETPPPGRSPALDWPELGPPGLVWPTLLDPSEPPAVIGARTLVGNETSPQGPCQLDRHGPCKGPARQVADAPWPSWRAGSAGAAPASAPASHLPGSVEVDEPEVSRPGTPASATRPERPAPMGHSPIPRALGAQGRGVFDAMASTLAPAHHHPGQRWPSEPGRLVPPTASTD